MINEDEPFFHKTSFASLIHQDLRSPDYLESKPRAKIAQFAPFDVNGSLSMENWGTHIKLLCNFHQRMSHGVVRILYTLQTYPPLPKGIEGDFVSGRKKKQTIQCSA